MFGLGIGELLVILVIVLIIFGAGKLPEIGDGLGRGIRSFRKAVRTPDEIDITPESTGSTPEHDSPSDSAAEAKKSDEGGTQA
jgi:sec-independent protein translocase protein TatA